MRVCPGNASTGLICWAVFCFCTLCWFVFVYSWDYVNLSWRVMESSPESGGLPYLFLLKSLLLAMPILLALQGLHLFLSSVIGSFLMARHRITPIRLNSFH